MTRTVTTALLTALSQAEVEPYYAVELLLDDPMINNQTGLTWQDPGYLGTNAIRIWTGYGDRDIYDNTYLGGGNLLGIDGMEEVNDLSAKGITLSFTGISSSIVSLALQEAYQHRPARVLFGTRDTSTPIEVFSGFMDTMSIEDTGETSTISLTVESKLVILERASNRRYTQENHIARHPNDTFFSYVSDLQDKEIVWGREIA